MYKRRSRLEIILNILSAVREGIDKPTRIMYAAKMSWEPVQRMLSHLLEQGLLEVKMNTDSRRSKNRYMITEKGADMLDYFDKASELLHVEFIYT